MQLDHSVAGANFVSRLGKQEDADGRIDRVLCAVAAGAEREGRAADQIRGQTRHIPSARRAHHMPLGSSGQTPIVIDHTWIASLIFDNRSETLETGPGSNGIAHAPFALGPVSG